MSFDCACFSGGYVYIACAKPYCKDVTVDSSLGTIDYDSLFVSDEYIFVQVKEICLAKTQLMYIHYCCIQFEL